MLDSIVLGIVQGITEFLPISSSAHLVFFQAFLKWTSVEIWFDIILHTATLLAVLFYFRKDLLEILLKKHYYIKLIIIGSVPTALIGWFFKDFVEAYFSSVLWSAFFLLITGFLLFITKYARKSDKDILKFSTWEVLLVGVMQGLAILPGISRSGSTIALAIMLGWEKKEAAKFSFLLSIPAIAGAALLGFKEFSGQSIQPDINYIAGFILAFISGLIALHILFRMLLRNKLHYFSYYCWIVGIILIIIGT
jgi:undecaprenyl-diphosphatase